METSIVMTEDIQEGYKEFGPWVWIQCRQGRGMVIFRQSLPGKQRSMEEGSCGAQGFLYSNTYHIN